jgi:hypothetical protein
MTESWPTGLDVARNCEDWPVIPDLKPAGGEDEPFRYEFKTTVPRSGLDVPVATLRRIGWVDQKGRVWLECPPAAQFDGGSLTPLLIDPGERS